LSNFNANFTASVAMGEHPRLGLWTYIKTTVSIRQWQNQVARERIPIITQTPFWITWLVLWGRGKCEGKLKWTSTYNAVESRNKKGYCVI
jgi:hypothetical protein